MSTSQASQPQIRIDRQRQTARYFVEEPERTKLNMVLIPGGSFMMGSPEDELEHRESESPQHLVSIPTFFMGMYPVTQAQWRGIAALQPVNRDLDLDPSHFTGDNHPVEQVSWYEAVEFCDRLSRETGRPYRLPSEAEWEYACRAGTTTPFHFGETLDAELANYQAQDEKIGDRVYPGIYGRGRYGEYRKKTTPVGYFQVANAFGLSDMHGNVWEWCLDHWHENYEGAPEDGSAWIDQNDNRSLRLLRGGSWDINPRACRSAFRGGDLAGSRFNGDGFRVVCSAARTQA